MGWSYGVVQGKEVGYSVDAVCEHEGCKQEILKLYKELI